MKIKKHLPEKKAVIACFTCSCWRCHRHRVQSDFLLHRAWFQDDVVRSSALELWHFRGPPQTGPTGPTGPTGHGHGESEPERRGSRRFGLNIAMICFGKSSWKQYFCRGFSWKPWKTKKDQKTVMPSVSEQPKLHTGFCKGFGRLSSSKGSHAQERNLFRVMCSTPCPPNHHNHHNHPASAAHPNRLCGTRLPFREKRLHVLTRIEGLAFSDADGGQVPP